MLRPHGKRPFVHPVIMLLALGGMMFYTEGAMVLCFSAYAASGPVQAWSGAIGRNPLGEKELRMSEMSGLERKRW